MNGTQWNSVLALLLITGGLAGCGRGEGPELVDVRGVIKLDGEPLQHAIVRFQPLEGSGTYSSGLTDTNGKFHLKFN